MSGAAALIYEISWSRQIGLLFGHTVNAAAVVLASYFVGMAIGYYAGASWSSRVSPALGYGIAELIVAGWACLIPVLLSLSEAQMFASWLSSSSFTWQLGARVVFSFLLLLPATAAMGVTLPMMAEFLSSMEDDAGGNRTIAPRVSIAYAFNTFGALVGALLATYCLLVVVGVRNSSYLAAGLSAACAVAACVFANRVRRHASPDFGHSVRCGPASSDSQLSWISLVTLSGFATLALQVLYTIRECSHSCSTTVRIRLASSSRSSSHLSLWDRFWHLRYRVAATFRGSPVGMRV